ncbi:hypothetical protein GCM10011390_50340 [Aureimonas endophytica]|uniref:Uncharacterized protein n=1 Tax=Aureimonas endophytica TaxID=2027858 RepID=A0A917A3C0_9HYPH|nr:hypothetical protein [Aureimonas endophytica]GGE24850.1 hypothetical protein GCM10011390_50340 [Aureimonas endophytica]
MEPAAVDLSFWAIAKVVLSAGVVSAVVTVALNWANEVRKERRSASFLALQVATLLENYAANCADKLRSHALAYDTVGHAGQWMAGIPPLDAFPSDEGAWKYLEPGLCERCFGLRANLRASERDLHEIYEFDEERGADLHANLVRKNALDAITLGRDLRSKYGYPQFSHYEAIKDTLDYAIRGFPDPRPNREISG